MNLSLRYKDPLKLIDTVQNGYGDYTTNHVESLNGLFVQGTSQSQINAVEIIGTDAHVYLDIENEFVLANAFRLEGMYLIADLFGEGEDESWYKIARVKVGQRKLLENNVNNVHCFLTKCDAMPYEETES